MNAYVSEVKMYCVEW